jgi:hypothetical protein
MPAKKALTLGQYVRRRNGVPPGVPGSLANMLRRSLGAGSLSKFWQYWNPIWGYYLGRYVHAPLRKYMPSTMALVLTFAVSGALHDVVVTIVRGGLAFIFTPWFILVGIGIVAGQALHIDYSGYSWSTRAAINITYIGTCLVIVLAVK